MLRRSLQGGTPVREPVIYPHTASPMTGSQSSPHRAQIVVAAVAVAPSTPAPSFCTGTKARRNSSTRSLLSSTHKTISHRKSITSKQPRNQHPNVSTSSLNARSKSHPPSGRHHASVSISTPLQHLADRVPYPIGNCGGVRRSSRTRSNINYHELVSRMITAHSGLDECIQAGCDSSNDDETADAATSTVSQLMQVRSERQIFRTAQSHVAEQQQVLLEQEVSRLTGHPGTPSAAAMAPTSFISPSLIGQETLPFSTSPLTRTRTSTTNVVARADQPSSQSHRPDGEHPFNMDASKSAAYTAGVLSKHRHAKHLRKHLPDPSESTASDASDEVNNNVPIVNASSEARSTLMQQRIHAHAVSSVAPLNIASINNPAHAVNRSDDISPAVDDAPMSDDSSVAPSTPSFDFSLDDAATYLDAIDFATLVHAINVYRPLQVITRLHYHHPVGHYPLSTRNEDTRQLQCDILDRLLVHIYNVFIVTHLVHYNRDPQHYALDRPELRLALERYRSHHSPVETCIQLSIIPSHGILLTSSFVHQLHIGVQDYSSDEEHDSEMGVPVPPSTRALSRALQPLSSTAQYELHYPHSKTEALRIFNLSRAAIDKYEQELRDHPHLYIDPFGRTLLRPEKEYIGKLIASLRFKEYNKRHRVTNDESRRVITQLIKNHGCYTDRLMCHLYEHETIDGHEYQPDVLFAYPSTYDSEHPDNRQGAFPARTRYAPTFTYDRQPTYPRDRVLHHEPTSPCYESAEDDYDRSFVAPEDDAHIYTEAEMHDTNVMLPPSSPLARSRIVPRSSSSRVATPMGVRQSSSSQSALASPSSASYPYERAPSSLVVPQSTSTHRSQSHEDSVLFNNLRVPSSYIDPVDERATAQRTVHLSTTGPSQYARSSSHTVSHPHELHTQSSYRTSMGKRVCNAVSVQRRARRRRLNRHSTTTVYCRMLTAAPVYSITDRRNVPTYRSNTTGTVYSFIHELQSYFTLHDIPPNKWVAYLVSAQGDYEISMNLERIEQLPDERNDEHYRRLVKLFIDRYGPNEMLSRETIQVFNDIKKTPLENIDDFIQRFVHLHRLAFPTQSIDSQSVFDKFMATLDSDTRRTTLTWRWSDPDRQESTVRNLTYFHSFHEVAQQTAALYSSRIPMEVEAIYTEFMQEQLSKRSRISTSSVRHINSLIVAPYRGTHSHSYADQSNKYGSATTALINPPPTDQQYQAYIDSMQDQESDGEEQPQQRRASAFAQVPTRVNMRSSKRKMDRNINRTSTTDSTIKRHSHSQASAECNSVSVPTPTVVKNEPYQVSVVSTLAQSTSTDNRGVEVCPECCLRGHAWSTCDRNAGGTRYKPHTAAFLGQPHYNARPEDIAAIEAQHGKVGMTLHVSTMASRKAATSSTRRPPSSTSAPTSSSKRTPGKHTSAAARMLRIKSNGTREITVRGLFGGVHVDALIDTGAHVNLVSYRWYHHHRDRLGTLQPRPSYEVSAADGAHINCVGTIDIPVKLFDPIHRLSYTRPVEFLVVHRLNTSVLAGIGFCDLFFSSLLFSTGSLTFRSELRPDNDGTRPEDLIVTSDLILKNSLTLQPGDQRQVVVQYDGRLSLRAHTPILCHSQYPHDMHGTHVVKLEFPPHIHDASSVKYGERGEYELLVTNRSKETIQLLSRTIIGSATVIRDGNAGIYPTATFSNPHIVRTLVDHVTAEVPLSLNREWCTPIQVNSATVDPVSIDTPHAAEPWCFQESGLTISVVAMNTPSAVSSIGTDLRIHIAPSEHCTTPYNIVRPEMTVQRVAVSDDGSPPPSKRRLRELRRESRVLIRSITRIISEHYCTTPATMVVAPAPVPLMVSGTQPLPSSWLSNESLTSSDVSSITEPCVPLTTVSSPVSTASSVSVPLSTVRLIPAPVPIAVQLQYDINPALPAEMIVKLRLTLDAIRNAFSSNSSALPAVAPGVQHAIYLTDPQPIKQMAYRQSPMKQQVVRDTIQGLLSRGLIEESNSPWSSPIVLVPKHDGTWRMCIDYRKVNSRTRKDAYPIPLIDECLAMCKGARWLSVIDIKDAYHHVEMEPSSVPITAFVTPDGLFQWKRMPFGLSNAPATFQRYVDWTLRGLVGKVCAAFFDDCLIYSSGDVDSHIADIASVLERLASCGLEANIKKCRFGYEEVLFVGHLLSHGTIRPDPSKVKAVNDIPAPTNLTELRSFLGLVNYYHKFIKGFAWIAVPLYRLTRKEVPFDWTGLATNAFNALKAALTSADCLYAPDTKLPFILQTDASGLGIAGVLTQIVNGDEHPVGFASRQLNSAESRYSATEWECLAVVWSVGQFEPFLIDAPFTIVTDHSALVWLPTANFTNARISRWIDKLKFFNFTVVHRAGTSNGNADALSRVPIPGSEPPPSNDMADVGVSHGSIEPHFVRMVHEILLVTQPFYACSSIIEEDRLLFPIIGTAGPVPRYPATDQSVSASVPSSVSTDRTWKYDHASSCSDIDHNPDHDIITIRMLHTRSSDNTLPFPMAPFIDRSSLRATTPLPRAAHSDSIMNSSTTSAIAAPDHMAIDGRESASHDTVEASSSSHSHLLSSRDDSDPTSERTSSSSFHHPVVRDSGNTVTKSRRDWKNRVKKGIPERSYYRDGPSHVDPMVVTPVVPVPHTSTALDHSSSSSPVPMDIDNESPSGTVPVVPSSSDSRPTSTASQPSSSTLQEGDPVDQPEPSLHSNRFHATPLSSYTIVDLSKLRLVIAAQYAEPDTCSIINYKLHSHLPSSFTEAQKRYMINHARDYVLIDQSDGVPPALFYSPHAPKRGLSSLVPSVPRLIIPSAHRTYLIELFHNSPFGGHMGIRRTYHRMSVNYYWSTMLNDIVAHIKSCIACARMKVSRQHTRVPVGIMTPPVYPFELISMDFVGPMPKAEGFAYVLTVVDHFSRWAITIPTFNMEAATVAQCLIDHVFCRYGLPNRLLSDNGTQFRSALCVQLHQSMKINLLFSSAYHPQTNGMVERFNGTLQEMLRSIGVEYGVQWIQVLQIATFAYNTSVHEATGYTPYYALYGREATTPGDVLSVSSLINDQDSSSVPIDSFATILGDNVVKSHTFIRDILDRKLKENIVNRSIVARVPTYALGSQVLVRSPATNTRTGGGHASGTTPQYTGPYIVLQRLSELTYVVQLISDSKRGTDRKPRHVWVGHLKQYLPTAPEASTVLPVSFVPHTSASTPIVLPLVGVPHRSSVPLGSSVPLVLSTNIARDQTAVPRHDLVHTSSSSSVMPAQSSLSTTQSSIDTSLAHESVIRAAGMSPHTAQQVIHVHRSSSHAGRRAAHKSQSVHHQRLVQQSIHPYHAAHERSQLSGRKLYNEDLAHQLPLHHIEARASLPRRR